MREGVRREGVMREGVTREGVLREGVDVKREGAWRDVTEEGGMRGEGERRNDVKWGGGVM